MDNFFPGEVENQSRKLPNLKREASEAARTDASQVRKGHFHRTWVFSPGASIVMLRVSVSFASKLCGASLCQLASIKEKVMFLLLLSNLTAS